MVTNFFRIKLPFDSFQIQRLPYNEDKFNELRHKHNKDASFFRNSDFIYISPRKGADLELGELITLKVEESPTVILSLIRHLTFRTFRDAFPDRIPESFSPLRFFSTKEQHDVIGKFLPEALQGQISYPRMVEVQSRQIIEDGKPLFGLLIGSKQRWRFGINLQELLGQGFDVLGKSVLESVPIPGLEGVLAADESLLGEIVSIDGEEAEIKTNDGLVRKKLNGLHLQRTREQIGAFLAFKLGVPTATRLFQSLREERKDRERPNFFFAEAARFASWFSAKSRIYENNDGFCFTVTTNNQFNGPSVSLHRTNLIFDYGPGASENTPFAGLSKFGPFNAARFARNDLRILVIFHPQSRGAVTQFLKRLIDGIPESKYFQRGLQSLFKLTSVQPTLKELDSLFPEAYEKAVDEAVRDADARGFDLALVECAEGSKLIPTKENPYYRARARLMSYGIPTQGVRDEHLRASTYNLEWTLGPMALQIYAKVGGTPWRLPGTQSVDREILVGIGNSLERTNLWSGAEQSRIVGITTFFLGDGSYMLGERLKSVPYSEYFGELLKSLKNSIETVAQQYAWKEGDSMRIVFHIFKPIKHIEADVVAQLIDSFPQFKILFAFVTISTEHPWMMFRGVAEKNGKLEVTLCERGDNLILDSHNCLLQIRGDRDRANKKQRPPHPVSIRVHEKSTYKDLKFIAQQIHDFAFLSWRSFFPSETPVTIFYSSLIAAESSKLSKIPGWKVGFLDQHFRHKQWFLLEQRQALAKGDQNLKRFQMFLDGNYSPNDGNDAGDVRESLLTAIAINKSDQFQEIASKIGERKISADSDWCSDDYLIFLLLLGNEKFGRPLNFLPRVIEARRNNPNPIPRKINEIFAALERQEFGMEGEFCFLKIPFLKLVGKLQLDVPAAMKALQAMSDPQLFDHFSPFLKLLTQKAYDLILTERQPLATETTIQLIEGFEKHAKNLSIRQWWRIVVALPGRIISTIILAVLGIGLIPVLFGFGYKIATYLVKHYTGNGN